MSEQQKKQGGHIAQAWLVILLAALYGVSLAGVQISLGPLIEQNKKNETLNVIPQIVPGADRNKIIETQITGADGQKHLVYEAKNTNGQTVGWVIPSHGQGFANVIEILVGVNKDVSTITGMYVLDQKETPGLGNYIVDAEFRDQFKDKSADPKQELTVVTTDPTAPNEILAITGATVSSDAVTDIVNSAIANLRDAIRKLPKGKGD